MNTFHVNPETGNVGKCRATQGNCPFGSDEQHFGTPELAQKAYETQMENYEAYRQSPMGKLDMNADNAVQALKAGIAKSVRWLDDHPFIVAGGFGVLGAAAAAVISYDLATDYYASTTSDAFTGTLTEGESRTRLVGVLGKGGHLAHDAAYQVMGPDGQILEYVDKNSKLVADGTERPLHLYSDGSVHNESIEAESKSGPAGIAALGAAAGAVAGTFSGFLAYTGVGKISDYLDAKWNLRHDGQKRYNHTSWS